MIGRPHGHSSKWYTSRHKYLKGMGLIETKSNPTILKKWRAFLEESIKTKTNVQICKQVGIGLGALHCDLRKLKIVADTDGKICPPISRTDFDANPYKYASKLFSHNKETGEITREKVLKKIHAIHIGRITHQKTFSIAGRMLSARQLAWILVHKEMPNGSITTRDGTNRLTRDNMAIINPKATLNDGEARIENVIIHGKEYCLQVDSTKPTQPKTGANAMRVSGKCAGCGNYQKCGDNDFMGGCIGQMIDVVEGEFYDAY